MFIFIIILRHTVNSGFYEQSKKECINIKLILIIKFHDNLLTHDIMIRNNQTYLKKYTKIILFQLFIFWLFEVRAKLKIINLLVVGF